ncbi:MAG: hypothetical protein PHN75_02775 [Syntrophales bacterium]|nr:hypothetical protein [Syntrophales bacterium]
MAVSTVNLLYVLISHTPVQPVTFIYTNSLDLTTDLLISKIGTEHVYRFNFDLWRDYRIKLDRRGLEIQNPAGRILHSDDIAKLYWRRPHKTSRLYPDREIPEEDLYMEEELSDALCDMVNLFWAEGRVVLVEPMADSRVGKLVQLKVAEKYFHVPSYKFVSGSAACLEQGKESIVKSLTSQRVKGSTTLYTTKIVEDQLDPATPWMIQDYVHASKDITVVFVRGELFGFELERAGFLERTVDWREMGPDAVTDAWRPHSLSADMEAAIRSYMGDLSLHYGRLDLLFSNGDYFFLEVNANGEWAWLDFEGKEGLLARIIEEIHPLTPRYRIPVERAIRI